MQAIAQQLLQHVAAAVSETVSELKALIITISTQVVKIAASVCAPDEQGSAHKRYAGMFHMVEEKLEWCGSKVEMCEQRMMREQFAEFDLQRIMHQAFCAWDPSMDKHWLARQFEQEYYRVWLSRRRLSLKWSPQHERLCKCHLLVAVYSDHPDYENIDKITRLVR